MSQFGVMLLMFAIVIGMVGLIKFFAWLTDLQERGGVGAAVQRGYDRYVDRRESVRPFVEQEKKSPPPRIMSPETTRPNHTDMRLVYTSDDLTRTAAKLTERERIIVLAAMRDNDKKAYSANRIAAFLGGDRNSVLAILREARPAPETTEDAPYTTPIAQRPTAAQFESDPELAYQPPPR